MNKYCLFSFILRFCLSSKSQSGFQAGQPWWKSNFFISQPVLFGTWDGVFTSCLINIFGVIVFLRSGWIVGQAGIINAVFIVVATGMSFAQRSTITTSYHIDPSNEVIFYSIGTFTNLLFSTVSVVLTSVMSAVGICERCRMESGGVYFLLAHVLGSRFGGAIGLLYVFGQVNHVPSLIHCHQVFYGILTVLMWL